MHAQFGTINPIRQRTIQDIQLTLFDLNKDEIHSTSSPDYVRVLDTHVGKGVYAVRSYPATAVIGEIKGELMDDPKHGTEYTFEAPDGLQLEPDAPFRFINHGCDPNCEFEWIEESEEESSVDGSQASTGLYLSALRNIDAGEQLTIDYNWPATYAIRCQCKQARCRGWVVSVDELETARMLNRA